GVAVQAGAVDAFGVGAGFGITVAAHGAAGGSAIGRGHGGAAVETGGGGRLRGVAADGFSVASGTGNVGGVAVALVPGAELGMSDRHGTACSQDNSQHQWFGFHGLTP
ncbi:MAG TPA: hypothetical protein VIN66_06340, partial [Rheinheimera sp.]